MKKIIQRGKLLITGFLLLICCVSQARHSVSTAEEWTSNNGIGKEVSYQSHSEVTKLRIIRADELKFFRTYVDNRFCGIEITNPNGSYDLVLKDNSGNVCARYNSEIVSDVDMAQVRDSTLPLFRKSEHSENSSTEQPEALVRVSDIIHLVKQNAVGGEKIKLHPTKTKSEALDGYPTARMSGWNFIFEIRFEIYVDNIEVING